MGVHDSHRETYTLWAVTIMETLGLTMAKVSHGGRDQGKLQCTIGEVDTSARLQDS